MSDLIGKLRGLFQSDQQELNPGMYRVLQARAAEIEAYLGERLEMRVNEALGLSDRRGEVGSLEETEEAVARRKAVFTHLLTFFSRYYEKGAFIGKCRFANDPGNPDLDADVVLHWANKDQYYTKSTKGSHSARTLPGRPNGRTRARETQDGFIHKDLGWFLRRELDEYVLKEAFPLDNLSLDSDMGELANWLRLLQGVRTIALELIEIVARWEDVQKQLWLKKKFVTDAHYLVTFDRVLEPLYRDIADNPAQWEQWRALGLLEPAALAFAERVGETGRRISREADTVADVGLALDRGNEAGQQGPDMVLDAEQAAIAYLKAHPSLMVDSSLFPPAFQDKLLAGCRDLDAQTDGVLVQSDNFQALTLLEERYRGQVKCLYLDPPYNAPASLVHYKNSFPHSTWLTMMENRLTASLPFQTRDGTVIVAIDKYEHERLSLLLAELCPAHDLVSVAIEHNRKGTQGDYFSYTHEYAVFAISPERKSLNKVQLPESEWEYANLRNWGSESTRGDAANCFYPIYVRDGQVAGFGEVCPEEEHPPGANVLLADGTIAIYPVDAAGVERKWRYARQSVSSILPLLKVKTGRNGDLQVMKAQPEAPYKTVWHDSRYNAGDYGTKVLGAMGLPKEMFAFPKSIHTTRDCLAAVVDQDSVVLDYFAGSGTTGQAVMMLNREDPTGEGRRKYVLVEQGDYFDTVIKPRIQKTVYSDEWKDGRPTKPESGISHLCKVLRLESYEDALCSLDLGRLPERQAVEAAKSRDKLPGGVANEAYGLLAYRLDRKRRALQLSMESFRHPFACRLKAAIDSREAEAEEERSINLVETFNYLLGLREQTRLSYKQEQGIVAVAGTTPSGERALILWRDCVQVGDEELRHFCRECGWTEEAGFDAVYVNGDHQLTAAELAAGVQRVLAIEPIFLGYMFGANE